MCIRDRDGPSNGGRLCVKGRFGSYKFVHSDDRIRTPLIKNHTTGEFEPATWDEALDLVSSKFMEIKKKYGPDAVSYTHLDMIPDILAKYQ